MSNPYPERPAQDPSVQPDYDMWGGTVEPSYGGYGDPYEEYGDPYAQQEQQLPEYPVAPPAALPADVPPAPDFSPTPIPEGPTPEEEERSRNEWAELTSTARFAAERLTQTYAERRAQVGKAPADAFDEEGRLIARAPEHQALADVTPNILLVRPTRFRLNAENLREAWQQRRFKRIGRMLLPQCVEEVPIEAAWTVTRSVTDAETTQADEPNDGLTDAQRYARKHSGNAAETAPVTAEGPKHIEHIAVTRQGELLRFTGSDDAPREPGKPLRFVVRNEVASVADDAGDDEKKTAEKLKADEEVVTDYLNRNKDAFMSTMTFEGEMDAESRSRIPRQQISYGLTVLLDEVGIGKAKN